MDTTSLDRYVRTREEMGWIASAPARNSRTYLVGSPAAVSQDGLA